MSINMPSGSAAAGGMPGLSGRRVALAVLVLSFNFGVVFFDRNAVGFLIPFIQEDLSLTSTQIGALAAALALTWALSGYIIGHLADHYGRRKMILLLSTTAFSLASFVTGAAWSFATLLMARLLMGMAEGAVMPVSQSITADTVPEGRRGIAMGVMQAFGSNLLGGMIAPLVLVGLATQFGWRTTFYLTAIPGLVCVLLMMLFVPEPAQHRHHEDEEAGRPTHLIGLLLHGNVLLCCLISICLVAYNSICWYFAPMFLTRDLGMAPQEMSWLVSVLGLSAVITAFTVPALSDRLGRKPVMILFSLIGMIMPLSMLYLPTGFATLAPAFFFGWAVLGVYPIFMAIVPIETVGRASGARVVGAVLGVGELFGGVFGPGLAGFIADMTTQTAPFWMMAALTLIAAILSFGLRETAPVVRARRDARLGAKTVS